MLRATTRRLRPLRTGLIHLMTCGAIGLSAAAEPAPAVSSNKAELKHQLQRAAVLAEAGQFAEAERLYRNVVQYDPQDRAAYEALTALASTRSLQSDSIAAIAARTKLPEHFAVHQTDRFVLISDVAEAQTIQNARWVERAFAEFNRFARECGLRPMPLQHKLVCILFDRREDYLTFAQTHDGLKNVDFTGYYSPRHDRMVFSVEPDGAIPRALPAAAPGAVASSSDGKAVLGFDSRGVDTDATAVADHEHDGDQPHEVPSASAAKCVHETIHQLMFHTRLMSPDVQYPLWICEGLSTAFETDLPGRAFGPDHDYAPRLQAFQTLLRNDDLVSLRELVGITQLRSDTPRLTRAMYQQSYALVTWLCRERPEPLREYLHLMRSQSAGKRSPARHLELFESVFGDVEKVEESWLGFERSGARNHH